MVLVTRWREHWLFGEKVKPEGVPDETKAGMRVKGWFPRKSAVELYDENEEYFDENEDDSDKNKKLD